MSVYKCREGGFGMSSLTCGDLGMVRVFLKLWLIFLKRAHKGLSLNGLVFRNPTKIIISDSCPYGMGGMTSNGRSWQLSVSPDAPFSSDDAANNVLEFIALAITLKTEIDELKKQKLTEEVILALSDNTSAIHWVFKTGRVQQNSKYFKVTNFVAQSIATWLMQSNNFICTQHIPGIHNFVTDLLSFQGTVRVRGKGGAISDKINPLTEDCPPNDVLTDRILSTCPQLVPTAF